MIRTKMHARIDMAKYFDLEISILEIEPRIWRRFQLAAVSSFETLHDAIQDAFRWQRQHLFEFRHLDKNSEQTKLRPPVRRIAGCRQAETLDNEIVPFADELKISSFFAKIDDQWLREKYRGWMRESFDLASTKSGFDDWE